MASNFNLIGVIPVTANCAAQLEQLRAALEPKDDDFLHLDGNRLYIYIDGKDAPYCFVGSAMEALCDFCIMCASEQAIIEAGVYGMLVVGPDLATRERVRDAYEAVAGKTQLCAA